MSQWYERVGRKFNVIVVNCRFHRYINLCIAITALYLIVFYIFEFKLFVAIVSLLEVLNIVAVLILYT